MMAEGRTPATLSEERRAIPDRPSTATIDSYERFCLGFRSLCGIDLGQYKRKQMERRIRTYCERREIDDLEDLLRTLERSSEELERFLDRVTINVSQLWRNPEQWQLLETRLLPELAADGRLRAWSAGSSYGAEAYTLASLCRKAIPCARVQIKGTDIDKRMVERARRGVLAPDDARTAPAAELERWFDRTAEGWEAKPELKAIVSFEQGDLLRVKPRPESFDLVLCRNTVIYFNEDIRDDLHSRLASSLRPGGVLIVGSTERVSSPASIGLRPELPFMYRKD